MTDVPPGIADGPKIIQAYGDGGFRISDVRITNSIIVLANRVLDWSIDSIEAVDVASLAEVIKAPEPIDILLIGSGHGAPRVDQAVRDALRHKGIVIDVMNTGAACRTYNLLVADSRQVAAALIAV